MNLRKYNSGDRAMVVELWRTVFPDTPPRNNPDRVINEKLNVDDLIFVADSDDIIVGACIAGYDGHRGWLYSVAVLPCSRRSGVGSQLVRYAVSNLQKLGCTKVNIQIRSTNSQVASFYESLGFTSEDRLSMGILTG